MQVVLVMFRADGERRSFSIVRDMTVVGRREDCDLRIPLGEISRKHFRLIKDGDSVRLEDLGSSNGTYHNGQRVQEAMLSPGDTLAVGPVQFVVQIDGVPADEEIQPSMEAAGAVGAGPSEELAEFVPVESAEADADAPSDHTPEAPLISVTHETAETDVVEPEPDFNFALDETHETEQTDDFVEFDAEEPTPHDHPAQS